MATSSGEAEFRAVAHGICELLWINKLIKDPWFPIDNPINLYYDDKAVIDIAHNVVWPNKHIEVDRDFNKEKLNEKQLRKQFVPSGSQVADIFARKDHW